MVEERAIATSFATWHFAERERQRARWLSAVLALEEACYAAETGGLLSVR